MENYRRQSADGISLAFLLVWFVGDMANLAGASWARLVPTVIALAVYFCIADLVLLLQCLYYNTLNSRRQRLHQQHRQKLGPAARKSSAASQREPALHHHHPHPHHHRDSVGAQSQERAWQGAARLEAGEEQPLLSHRDSTGSIGLPGSHRRSLPSRMRRRTGSSSRDDAPFADGLGEIAEDNANHSAISDYSDGADGASGSCAKGAESRAIVFAILRNGFSVAAVAVAGALGWMVAWRVGAWSPAPPEDAKGSTDMIAGAEILGYVSAACYLG